MCQKSHGDYNGRSFEYATSVVDQPQRAQQHAPARVTPVALVQRDRARQLIVQSLLPSGALCRRCGVGRAALCCFVCEVAGRLLAQHTYAD